MTWSLLPDDPDGGEGAGNNGAEIDVTTFQFSACKKEYPSSYPPPELLTGRESLPLVGLQCVAWDLTDTEHGYVDLVNFEETCGFPADEGGLWHGEARQGEEGELELVVEWDFTGLLACGGCLQDFSFELAGLQGVG